MVGTYAAAVAVCGASVALGAAALALCGARRWSWAASGVGLGLLLALCWGTARLPGGGATAVIAAGLATLGAVAFLRGRLDGAGEAWRRGAPVALAALALASLPFAVAGHFGILGTGFNPDMSQHLLAAERLAEGHRSQLLAQGYPLGPHAVVVALGALGIGPVQAFDGLALALAVVAALTALACFERVAAPVRVGASLLVALPYVVASYLAQGAFKELAMALFLLAFVLALREAGRAWAGLPLRLVPAALLAAGAIYAYSFPALVWLGAAALVWAAAGAGWRERLRGAGWAALVFAVLVAPELGRMIDFQRFETFDPDGPGLGNLFGQISPLEALGIWPSGDFRVAPGDGAAPALSYYLGAAFALALLAGGALRCARAGERAILAGLAAAALAYLAARLGGTAYTAAKAIEIAAPLVTLTVLAPLFTPPRPAAAPPGAAEPGPARPGAGGEALRGVERVALALFGLAAGVCSILALANAPVGPTSYSPALAEMRPLLAGDATLVLAPRRLLDRMHGARYLAWELRGGRVCIAADDETGTAPPRGVRFVIATDEIGLPYPGLRPRRADPPYALWEVPGPIAPRSPCPLIEVRQERRGAS